MGCEHYGQYDRRRDECAVCQDCGKCREIQSLCYGRAYRRDHESCMVCPLAGFCRSAGDVSFHQNRHGEPSIVQVEDLAVIEQFTADEEKPEVSIQYGGLLEQLEQLLEDCCYSPQIVAIVIARHAGASYSLIAKSLKLESKQHVLWKIKQIKNPALQEYLRSKKISKYFNNIIKEQVQEEAPAKQLFFSFQNEKRKGSKRKAESGRVSPDGSLPGDFIQSELF